VIIVNGTFEVDPDERDAFLAERGERMRTSRAEAGCLEYTFAADPLQPERVVLFERWASQADLDAHLAGPSPATQIAARRYSITLYDVTGERELGR
jgi:quinol monooxygenase YgiN